MSITHSTFVLERRYDVPPARVFAAFADEAEKRRWFIGPPEQWTLLEASFDFRVGGVEILAGRWPDGTVTDFDCRYHDIVADSRIIYAYAMRVNGGLISVSLGTLEFIAEGAGCHLKYTEQGAYHEGGQAAADSRRQGTSDLFDRMAATFTMAEA